jgi:hypothetical protein
MVNGWAGGHRISTLCTDVPVYSLEGWSAVMGFRRSGERSLTDERILRSNDFLPSVLTARQAPQIIVRSCEKEGISIQELLGGNGPGPIPRVQPHLAWKLAREFEVPFAKLRERLAVSTSTISQFLDGKQIG